MTDFADPVAIEDLVSGGNPLEVPSRLQQLKERRERLLDATLMVEVPSWQGDLLGEFRVLGESERAKIERRQQQRGNDKPHLLFVDLIATACVRLHLRNEEGTPEPLRHAGQDVRFDDTLAALMGWDDCRTEADIVMHCFGHNTVALRAMSERIAGWMQDPRPATDQTVA